MCKPLFLAPSIYGTVVIIDVVVYLELRSMYALDVSQYVQLNQEICYPNTLVLNNNIYNY